jgi:hypothetical protein
MLAGTLPLAEAGQVFSAIYAVDLFLGNGDRHENNFVIENDGAGAPRIRVIDFSESPALIDPKERGAMPYMTTSTVNIGRILRQHYPFDQSAALRALNRLGAVATIRDILEGMPDDWLAANVRNEILAWWLSPDRTARIQVLKDGLSNGTLL